MRRVGFTWPGSKIRLAPTILKYLPRQGRKFVDLFAGRANVAFYAMTHCQYEEFILNDIRTHRFLTLVKEHGGNIAVPDRDKLSPEDFEHYAHLAKQGDITAILVEPHLTWCGGGFDGGGPRTEGGYQTPEAYQRNLCAAHQLLSQKNVRITNLDWLACLKEEQVGQQDAVVLDVPYMGSVTRSYKSEDILPAEVIEYLQTAAHPWVLTEYEQPLYVAGLGEPAFRHEVRPPNLGADQKKRVECIWANHGEPLRTVITTVQDVPEGREDSFYAGLSLPDLLKEIKASIDCVSFHRNRMNTELRQRLLPALHELRKRTYRKNPGFYDHLRQMGLNADTVRQWFYQSRTADEVVELIEEQQPEPFANDRDERTGKEHLLEAADRLARAVQENKITYAKKLATQWIEARGLL